MPGLRTTISDSARLAEKFRCSVAGRVQTVSSFRNSSSRTGIGKRAAEAAGAQGKFREKHALLFERQNALRTKDLIVEAGDVDLDVERFCKELKSMSTPRESATTSLQESRTAFTALPACL
jgi:streptomycin 6-kinase